MRYACLALILTFLAGVSSALEVEDHRRYPGTGNEELHVISTADLEVFEPYLLAFQAARPDLTIDYTVASSAELHRAIRNGAVFDLALSSAMDLQFQLANDGYAQRHQSDRTLALPNWAKWRDLIFAFTAEPAVMVLSTERFAGLPVPTTRQELVGVLRQHPDVFEGAIGTYDVRESGLGYLFATQEARSTDAYWRLSEVMGRLDPQLYCCSGQMIDDVTEGKLALAYNVLGSYAADRLARASGGKVQVLSMQDFGNVMLRTALIPSNATNPDAAGLMIDMLIDLGLRSTPENWPLPPLNQVGIDHAAGFSQIRLGPALMVYLDPLNRRAFLSEWENAMVQK
ncbi:iron(III) transport system substrate-binding protein [Thalassococcus halodurans]|uniref:Iron(III) transport system substrate-binding protein n=1 Tax=Thalassococcus halodurans TaxID=373675 RepID=A0A1H5WEI5_9RHOB|nr:ABC transporter substrate-binding protein [Thalassococcus halodurans]SEF97895.1 iron(III) transport system substrate-binding protein [Thalassococcus halodurans]